MFRVWVLKLAHHLPAPLGCRHLESYCKPLCSVWFVAVPTLPLCCTLARRATSGSGDALELTNKVHSINHHPINKYSFSQLKYANHGFWVHFVLEATDDPLESKETHSIEVWQCMRVRERSP